MSLSAWKLLLWLASGSCLAEVSFNRDIRPILSDTCFRCHGPDQKTRMAGLRLDIREDALKPTLTKAIPIVPGDPDKSAIIQRIYSRDAVRLMPPRYAHKELSESQKRLLRQWVAEGAKYESHWAYEPVKRPPVPEGVFPQARNPIDRFVRARLRKEGLRPSPEADRRTLIRRLSLDLTGLPPTVQETEAFLNDRTPGAYEKVVERLLASPRFAEKQALHWLDAVRYADTCGFHGDNPFPIWPYRDYVLKAFRDNKPFDVFTREQIAGDLLPGAGIEQLIASAYNRLNRTSAEGGIQPKEYLAKYAADRVRTTATVWLGTTLGCAECHDHKFDPFTTKDFYAMKAFFADILETGLVPDRGVKAWGTKLDLPTAEQQRERERLNWQLAQAREQLEEEARILSQTDPGWEKEVLRRFQAGELDWRFQRPLAAHSERGTELKIYNDEPVEISTYLGISLVTERKPGNGLVVAGGPNPDNDTYTIRFAPGAGTWTALGLEVVQDETLPGMRVARGSDRLVITEIEAELSEGGAAARKLKFSLATDSLNFPSKHYHPVHAIDGDPRTGWGVDTYGENSNLFLALRFQERLTTTNASVIMVRIRHDSEYRRATTGRLRLALSAAEHSWPQPESVREAKGGKEAHHGVPANVLQALRTPADKRTEAHRRTLSDYYAWWSNQLQPAMLQLSRLEAALGRLEAEIPRVVVTKSTKPRVTRILPRGNWMDDSGEVVEPAIPAYFGKLNVQGRATRLDLANWLVSEQNPLTARVFVNRMWRQFFGTGLSKVLDDLGSQGEWPTHPELLDWLAAEFMQPRWNARGAHAWDVKHLVRTIVTSHTYRQSSQPRPELEERDPENRLLARQNRFRVEAEIVRDLALAVSGLLVERFGGPSVRPYQPDGYLAALNFPKREYSASRGADLYRRGVYTFWQRTFLHPSLLALDAPSREECTVNRVQSNTPLQALVLLNDPIFVEAARVFAQHMLTDGGATAAERIQWAFRRAVGRPVRAAERAALLDLYRKNLARFQAKPEDAAQLLQVGEAPVLKTAKPAELAALATVARAILNLHETIVRN